MRSMNFCEIILQHLALFSQTPKFSRPSAENYHEPVPKLCLNAFRKGFSKSAII